MPHAQNARRAAEVLETFASEAAGPSALEAAGASALEPPPLSEDPSLGAFLTELDRVLLRKPSQVAASLNQPRLIERLFVPAHIPSRFIVFRIERSGATARIAAWLAVAGIVMAIAFGAMTAWLIFQDEIDAIAAEWTAQR